MTLRYLSFAFLLLFSSYLHSQEEGTYDGLKVGSPAQHYVAAHFATGYWSQKGQDFLCPVLGELEHTKIAIFTKQLNPETIRLAVELDRAMQKYPQLGRSFLVVSDEGSRSESMTDDELKTKMDQLKSCSADHELKKLSLAYLQFSTAPTRWRNSLKFFGNEDIVVAVIEPGIIPAANMNVPGMLPTRTVKPFYRFVEKIHSKELDQDKPEQVIERAISSLAEK